MIHSGILISAVGDDQRVITTHLQGENFLRLARELLKEFPAGLGAAGKKQTVNTVIPGKGTPCFLFSLH